MNNVSKARAKAIQIKDLVIPKLLASYTRRFSSFDEEIFLAMSVFDPENLDFSNQEYGLAELKTLETHFKEILEKSGYDFKHSKKEWKKLRVEMKSENDVKKQLSCASFWKTICTYQRKKFPNMCLMAEIVMSVASSNCTVERGFSNLTHALSDRRLSLQHAHTVACIIVRNNQNVWTKTNKDRILEKSVSNYLSTKRKRKISAEIQDEQVGSKKSKIEVDLIDHSDNDFSDQDSECSDTVTESENPTELDLASESDFEERIHELEVESET